MQIGVPQGTLARKRELTIRDDLSPQEMQELADLDERLGRLDFSTATRDPLYPRVVAAMTELRLADTGEAADLASTPEGRDRQRALARQVLSDLMKQEAVERQGEAQ